MEQFFQELKDISHDLLLLVEKKIQLKNQVTEPNLNWQDRMEIYSKINLINDYIENYSHLRNQ